MTDNWTKKFWKPVKPRDGKPIETLADARAYMLAMPMAWAPGRNGNAQLKPQWQQRSKGGTDATRDALTNALFINMKLDVTGE